MARKAEQGALQYAASVTEVNPPRIGGAGFISGVFNDFLANPRLPFNRLTPIGRWLGYFWDSKVAPLALNFADGTNTLDSRITFSRSSNATVTDSNGNIVYAPHNLLTFSEQFDNATWVKSNATVTANATNAPDGTITADKLIETASSADHSIRQPVTVISGSTYTISCYLKAAERTEASVEFFTGSTVYKVIFNLANGTYVSNTGTGSYTISSVGDGWWRVSLTAVATSTTLNQFIFPASGGITNYTGNGTSGIFVWGAQLNVGSLQPYYPTTVKNLLGFSEAFENAAWTKSNSFIQTNLLTFSEQFGNAAWVKDANSVLTSNVAVAPNGSTTADKHAVGTSTFPQLAQTITATVNLTYNFTIYVKADGLNFIQLRVRNQATPANFFRAIFNLTTGEVTQIAGGGTGTITSSSATDVGNGWYRCSIAGIADTTGTSLQVVTILTKDSAGTVATSSNSAATDGVLMWGAQLVQGASAGDYQQTTSAALPVMYQAPNGTMTADKLVENTATSTHIVQPSNLTVVANTPTCLSVYAKAGERTWFRLWDDSSPTPWGAYFDLANGVTGIVGAGATASITALGNGWYRCAIVYTNTTTISRPRIGIASADGTNSYTGDGTSGIYIWGAQLSDSASLDPYVNNPVAAPSSTAFYGPRFDYDPVTRQPRGLLIEESRANLFLQSEAFDNAAWSKSSATITANALTAPDGTLTADTIIASATGTTGVSQSPSISATSHSFSVYVKAGTCSWVRLFGPASTNNAAWFDLSLGVVGTTQANITSATITPVGNGWFRCTIVSVSAGAACGIRLAAGDADVSGASGTTLSVWGAQLEAGAFATSYIPTTTATVTRAADVAVIQGTNFSSWYKYDEGSIYAEGQTNNTTTAASCIVSVDDNTNNNRIQIRRTSNINASFRMVAAGQSIDYVAIAGSSTNNKYAVGASVLGQSFVVNGVQLTGFTSITAMPVATQMQVGNGAGSVSWNGYISRINYYSRRLDNSQLQAITQ